MPGKDMTMLASVLRTGAESVPEEVDVQLPVRTSVWSLEQAPTSGIGSAKQVSMLWDRSACRPALIRQSRPWHMLICAQCPLQQLWAHALRLLDTEVKVFAFRAGHVAL